MKNKREMKNKYSTVSLPTPLVEKIKKTIENTGYVSISDFVTDVIRTILVARSDDNKIDKKEEEMIKDRLKTLGYLK